MAQTAETGAAFRELLDAVASAEEAFLRGPNAVSDLADVLDGYVWAMALMRVALLAYVHADPDRPRFEDIVGPSLKWGGDNPDAFYQLAAVDGRQRYRIRGIRGDAAYLSLTVYGGPRDGSYGAQRTVATLNHREIDFGPDGRFEVAVGPGESGRGRLGLAPDSLFVITRDYLADPVGGRRARFEIEPEAPAPARPCSDAELAARFRAAARFVKEQLAFQPIPLPPGNRVQPPAPARQAFGWNAADACYAMGAFDLTPEQALVVRGRSPECAFFNVCLWNPFLHSFDARLGRASLNGFQAAMGPEGHFELVVSARDPGHPNWLATGGRRRGLLWFRWFLARTVPEPLETEVLPVEKAGR